MTMNDINLEIVHEINVRYWKLQSKRMNFTNITALILKYLLIPAVIAWMLA